MIWDYNPENRGWIFIRVNGNNIHNSLKGLGEAIHAVYPKTKQQLCIVHQIRNSSKFVQYKDRKEICADLKKIYGAVNLDDAEYALEEFREKWNKKYPSILRSWDGNWAEITTFLIIREKSAIWSTPPTQ